jgi:NAD(P)-dependent dehydrogenase (short-subunit alcohol dehydrogenase family)
VTARLDGKVAIVTGAGRGIGRAIARRLSADGATVVCAQRSLAEGEAVAEELRRDGAGALALEVDVASESSVADMARLTLSALGRVDVLCNNAGVNVVNTVVQTDLADFDRIMAVNARGPFLTMKSVIPHMLERGGSVINIGSIASTVALRRHAAYCASKGALLALTRQAALDYSRYGIRINAVAPAYVETEMFRAARAAEGDPEAGAALAALHPSRRLGTPDDVAGSVAYLASDDSAWVTGSLLQVDGGYVSA